MSFFADQEKNPEKSTKPVVVERTLNENKLKNVADVIRNPLTWPGNTPLKNDPASIMKPQLGDTPIKSEEQLFGDRILIVTNMRSGSTFVGNILSYDSETYYAFEPLWMLGETNRASKKNCSSYELPSLKDLLFDCKIDKFLDCFNGKIPRTRNRFTATRKNTNICKKKQHRVIKIIRFHQLEKLVQELATNGGTLLYLVRDPRGIMTSRKNVYKSWNQKYSGAFYKSELESLCKSFETNLKFLATEFRKYSVAKQNRVVVLRYEDFAYAPQEMAEKLYKFLRREMDNNVKKYIRENTNGAKYADIWSTRRNSTATAEAWRKKINWQDLLLIQTTCSKVMSLLGYTTVNTAAELKASISLVASIKADVPLLH